MVGKRKSEQIAAKHSENARNSQFEPAKDSVFTQGRWAIASFHRVLRQMRGKLFGAVDGQNRSLGRQPVSVFRVPYGVGGNGKIEKSRPKAGLSPDRAHFLCRG